MLGHNRSLPRLGLAVLLLACFLGATRFYDDFANCVLCTLIAPFQARTTNKVHFLSCSNVLQTVSRDAATVRDASEPGTPWDFFTPADGHRAELRVTLKKDRDTVLFYPRVSGSDGAVIVYAEDGVYRRRLFALHGTEGQWTAMGQQFTLDLRCAPYGFSAKDLDVSLVIVLTGKWSQLWHLGSAIFF